jgi:hypothetical protein
MTPKAARPTIIAVAAALAQEVRTLPAGRLERSAAGFHLALWRQDHQHRLVIARTDRLPSFEELQAISQAVGAPDCEPMRTVCMMTSPDGVYQRLPAYVIAWREVSAPDLAPATLQP